MIRQTLSFVGATLAGLAVVLSFSLMGGEPVRVSLFSGTAEAQSVGSGTCGLNQPAFCDTFDQPYLGGGRTGQLDPSRWSVARISGVVNQGQGMVNQFIPTPAMHCRTPVTGVLPPLDFFMCGTEFGESEHFMEAFHDQGNYVYNDARIRQAFDFTGRTGKLTFDVDAKNAGPHGWWVEVWITDQPIPGPHGTVMEAYPRNGVGLVFWDECGGPIPSGDVGSPKGGLGLVQAFHNYDKAEAYPWRGEQGVTLQKVACYQAMPDMQNHFEVRINQQHLEVWATDPMDTVLHQIGIVDGLNLPFSQGYVHFEHSSYNAAKAAPGVSHAQTYHWDNIGFDGPKLPVPAQYSIPDALTPGHDPGSVNLGYFASPGGLQDGPRTFTNVNVDGATGASLIFDAYFLSGQTINYRLNSGEWHTWTGANPPGHGWKAAIAPVSLSDLNNGTNTVDFASMNGDQSAVSNIELVLPGAVGADSSAMPMPMTMPMHHEHPAQPEMAPADQAAPSSDAVEEPVPPDAGAVQP